jgi:small-conductance mechanosensitive channel
MAGIVSAPDVIRSTVTGTSAPCSLYARGRRLIGAASLGLLLVTPMLAVAATPAAELKQIEEQATAPVIVDGATLFRVRGVSAYPAERRAQAIAERIRALARDKAVSLEALRVVEAADRSSIVVGDRTVMVVVNEDAETEGLDNRQVLAEVYARRITEAIQAYRHERSPKLLLHHALYALAVMAALAAVLFGLRWAFKRLDSAIEQRYKSKIQDVQIQSLRVLQAEQVWATFRAVLRTTWVLAVLVLLYVSMHFILGLFPWTRPFAQHLFILVLDPLQIMGRELVRAVPNLVFLTILTIIVRYALRMARLFFAAIERGAVKVSGFDRDWAWPTYRIVRLLAIAFAVVVAYPYIPGSESAAFKGVSLFLGVVFSLGSTSVISNIIAGYTMAYRRAFRVGDRIQINDTIGDVVERRLLVTRLRSPKNEEIVVPNSLILNSNVINYSSLAQEPGLILHTTVGIGYETPWRQVEAILLQAAERTQGLLREPSPFVLQKALGDFCVTYELNVYCDQPRSTLELYSALHRNILDVFNEYGVQIMTPAYENDPVRPKVVPKEQWFAPPTKPAG